MIKLQYNSSILQLPTNSPPSTTYRVGQKVYISRSGIFYTVLKGSVYRMFRVEVEIRNATLMENLLNFYVSVKNKPIKYIDAEGVTINVFLDLAQNAIRTRSRNVKTVNLTMVEKI